MQWISKPIWILILQATLLAALLFGSGRLEAHRVPDSKSYEEFPLTPVKAALEQTRTVGYPLFLRIIGGLSSDSQAIPICQYVFHVCAVLIFFYGLRYLVEQEWHRAWVASVLLYSNVVFRYINTIGPDALASSLSIASIGTLMLVLAHRDHIGTWLGLLVCVAAAIHTRPIYIFLIPLLPCLGVSLSWMRGASEQRQSESLVRLCMQLLAVSLAPLIVFCTFRWMLTDQFSLVSFGANNMAGVVTSFLDEQVAAELPESVQPMANEVLRRRAEIAATNDTDLDSATTRYSDIEARFDVQTWDVCVPAAERLYDSDWPAMNDGLRRLSIAIVRARPADYATWLAKALVRGVYMVVSELVMNPIYFVMLAVLLACRAWKAYWHGKRSQSEMEDGTDTRLATHGLELIALAFAAFNIAAVIITSPPLGRFTDPAGVFLMTVVANGILGCVVRLRIAADQHA